MSGFLDDPLQQAYEDACERELQAFKPGNVSVHSEGHDMSVDDFRRSAEVSAPHIANLGNSLGEKIYYSVWATRMEVGCNTNLGIVLLCAPMLQAMQMPEDTGSLRERLAMVLRETTRQDAAWVFRAIRLAQPAGLGEVVDQDVNSTPDVTLTEAMRLGSGRDRIAFQYANCYIDIFEFALSVYHTALDNWGDESWAAVTVFVKLLRRIPDSHIARKFGDRFTRMVTTRMAFLEEELSKSDRPELVLKHLQEVDAEFKRAGINPGTTADLTVASLLAVRLERLLGYHNEKSAMLV